MSTANPLEQLRRRMLSHATPAAFAALAEEHRRAGRLAEAIAVCRDGLTRYPTYVSARVTLGRALLDSGDVEAAVAELEHAVTQAPDNLAAVRALDAARAALAELPPPATAVDEPAPASEDAGDSPAVGDDWRAAMGLGPDGPQELGLGPDWTLPEVPLGGAADATDASAAPPESATGPGDGLPLQFEADAVTDPWLAEPATEVAAAHADAATMCFVPPHLQGDEPAGIWPVPATEPDVAPALADGPTAGAPVYGWSIAAPDGRSAAVEIPDAPEAVAAATPAVDASPSVWDAPTIDMPVVETAAASDVDLSADPGVGDSGVWRGLFVEPVSEGAAPASFAGWDAPGPAAPELPAWADEPAVVVEPAVATDRWDPRYVAEAAASGRASDEPDAGVVAATDASAAPVDASSPIVGAFGAVGPEEEVAALELDESAVALVTAVEVPASGTVEDLPSEARPVPAAERWAGSLASALDEVFAQAGQPQASLEPPTHASPAVRAAMADAAVDAAIEDTATRDELLTPALVSLQQMLDAVRARRAALFPEGGS